MSRRRNSQSQDSERGQATHQSWLLDQLTKSQFFHQKLHEYGLVEIAYAVESVQGEALQWGDLGISEKAWNKVIHQGIKPVLIFAHPYVLSTIPRSVGYYRGLSMVSLKSMKRIRLDTEAAEAGTRMLDPTLAQAVAYRLNELISPLIESDDQIDPRELDLWRGMTAGSTAQGSWQNKKGQAGEEIVKQFVRRRLEEMGGTVAQIEPVPSRSHEEVSAFTLDDGRNLRFGSEPDIAVYSKTGRIRAALEVKGGIDTAAVLERVGAAIKSLSRAKQENPDARTILIVYAVSMTPQARQELQVHKKDIDHWFTIEDVLNRDETRETIYRILGI